MLNNPSPITGNQLIALRKISITIARRLAITNQRLAGVQPPATANGILELFRDLNCVQIDPIRAVERTQYLVPWSRLGHYDHTDLNSLLWEERRLFEYWAHAASIVLTEDFPIFWRHMRDWASGDKPWAERARSWMVENDGMRSYILSELEKRGPLPSREIQDNTHRKWKSSGWTDGRNVNHMLNYLWEQGHILVSHRKGLTKFWDLRERVLPDWTPREDIDWPEAVYRAAQKSIRSLGIASPNHIERHFTRGNYPGLKSVLDRLERDGRIVQIDLTDSNGSIPGSWYIHLDDLPLLDRLEAGEWQPRTTLLSPFDNLICDRERTEQLFDYRFRIEIYVPKAKREYGYYVLPILHGDRLIGRIDPKMDRKASRLDINAVYAESDAPMTVKVAQSIDESIQSLAAFLGARETTYASHVPAGWRKILR